MRVEYLTQLIITPVPRDWPAKWLRENTDKRMMVEDFLIRVILEDKSLVVIRVPKGYISDGASIPKVFHAFYHPFSTESFWASIVHDYIYSHLYYRFSKKFADDLFKEMVRRDGGSWLMQNSFYGAVRSNVRGGGWYE